MASHTPITQKHCGVSDLVLGWTPTVTMAKLNTLIFVQWSLYKKKLRATAEGRPPKRETFQAGGNVIQKIVWISHDS